MEHLYILSGDPIALARARHGHKRVWDSQKELKLLKGLELRNQHKDRPLLQGPLSLEVTFFFPIPKSRSKKTQPGHYYLFTPDLSNCLKFVEDIGSGVIYPDDRTIVWIITKKVYDLIPRTEIKIMEL